MSHKHKKKGEQAEEKKPILVTTDTFFDGRNIRNVLQVGKKERSAWSSIHENILYTIEERDFEELECFLGLNTNIPRLTVSGEPNILVFFEGVPGTSSEPKEIFRYAHPNGSGYQSYLFSSQQPQQTKNTLHYIFGSKISGNIYSKNSWFLRKEFDDFSIQTPEYYVPGMHLLQGYIRVEGNEKNGKVKDIVTSVINLGENTVLEAIIGDGEEKKTYVSEGIRRSWSAYPI